MKTSRRQILMGAAATATSTVFNPRTALASALIKSLFRTSVAEAAGAVSPRYYLNMFLPGGPPRWSFDHWLRTNASDPAVLPTSYASTAFKWNATTRQVNGFEYKTSNYNGVLVPHIFDTLGAPGKKAMLDSMLVIRGFGSKVDGHGTNAFLQLYPLAGAPTISGLVAARSDRNFEAIQYPSRNGYPFAADRSIGINVLNAANPIEELLKPVSNPINKARLVRTANQDVFSNLRAYLNTLPSSSKGVDIAKSSLGNAYKLLQGNWGDLAETWTTLVADYENVIHSAIRATNIPYLNATADGSQMLQAISDESPGYYYEPNATKTMLEKGKNLISMTSNMSIASAAENFALAEFCIRNNLCSVLEMNLGRTEDLKIDPNAAFSAANSFSQTHDMHGTGGLTAMYTTSLYYRGMLSGLLLFRERLVAAGKWNNTVVHFVSEFDRTSYAQGAGSGHGFQCMISSVISGALSGGPYVVGNISTLPQQGEGTQGVGLPIANYATDEMPTAATMASTVSALLAVDSNPWKNIAPPLVSHNSDGTLVLPYGRGKLIG